jgi:homoaconitase/3-isopropylmalate dehydratase large subunit
VLIGQGAVIQKGSIIESYSMVAAEIVRGQHVAQGVVALVSAGSARVKREAEALGEDRRCDQARANAIYFIPFSL